MAFVVALIGTVYFARTNRPQAKSATDQAIKQSPLVEVTHGGEAPPETRVQAVAAVSDSKVELQPPSAPPLIASHSSNDKGTADKLFEFPAPKRADEQIAARPSGGMGERITGPASSTAEKSAPATTTSYPVTNPPAAAYPTASSPTAAYPQTTAPPLMGTTNLPSAAVPSRSNVSGLQTPANTAPDYRAQLPGQPPQVPARSGWTPPSGSAMTGQYQGIDNTARGSRYERTGSSPY
jgi:hypothetical protein